MWINSGQLILLLQVYHERQRNHHGSPFSKRKVWGASRGQQGTLQALLARTVSAVALVSQLVSTHQLEEPMILCRITGNAEKIRLWVRLAEDEVKVPGESSTPNENAMEVEEPRQDEKKQSNGSGRKKSPIEIDANETSTATRRSNRLITRNSKAKEEAFTLRKHETLLDLKKR